MVVLPFQDEGGLLCRAEEQGGVFALECLDQVLSGGGQSRVHNEQGELGEFFPLQPVQVAQGLLQPVAAKTGTVPCWAGEIRRVKMRRLNHSSSAAHSRAIRISTSNTSSPFYAGAGGLGPDCGQPGWKSPAAYFNSFFKYRPV